jgi:DNA-binding NarL/FixJ family response regulator
MGHTRPALLLVEDNGTLRRTLRRHLERRLPVDLVEAASGAEALALARRREPDVILLDMSLPDQSGIALIPQLQSEGRTPRIIVMSGYRDRLFDDKVMHAGAWACVSKETLGSQLEPLLWRALRAANGGLFGPAASRSRILKGLSLGLADAWTTIGLGIHWLDLNGPWAGKPRTRLLYLANVVELALVFVLKHQAFGF